MLYQIKPPTVEAFKWTGGPDQTEDPEWIVEAMENGLVRIICENTDQPLMVIKGTFGEILAESGDYIIKDRTEIFALPEPDFNNIYMLFEPPTTTKG